MYFSRIRDLREDNELSQEKAASVLGVTQTTYSKYELGKITVPTESLIKLADFYKVSLDYLVGRDVRPARTGPIKPGRYRHFKGGDYRVLGTAAHSETLEPMVVYQALYGERGMWVRPAAMWNERVERDGYAGPRFTYVGE